MISDADLIAAVTAYKVALRSASHDAAAIAYDDEKYEPYSFSSDAQEAIVKDVEAFIKDQYDNLELFMEITGDDWSGVGHNFALTRCGQPGFGIRGAAGLAVDTIIESCFTFGRMYPYLNDDTDEIDVEV